MQELHHVLPEREFVTVQYIAEVREYMRQHVVKGGREVRRKEEVMGIEGPRGGFGSFVEIFGDTQITEICLGKCRFHFFCVFFFGCRIR